MGQEEEDDDEVKPPYFCCFKQINSNFYSLFLGRERAKQDM